jgi:hypothetical protein
MYSCGASSNSLSSFFGWMQSTGQAIHACRIIYADAGLGDRKEVGIKEARTLRCACGRTIVIQAGIVYGTGYPRSGSRKQPV